MLLSLKSFVAEKRHGAIQKLFIKKRKRKKKSWEKMDKCPRYLKQWVLRCPPENQETNKIAPVLLENYFQDSKERYVFREQSRIRLATIYIHHLSTHMHILIWLYDSTLFGSIVWLYNIYIASMLFHHHSYELHISLSCRKKGTTSLLPWWGSTNTKYFERLESVMQWNLRVLFWKIVKTLE